MLPTNATSRTRVRVTARVIPALLISLAIAAPSTNVRSQASGESKVPPRSTAEWNSLGQTMLAMFKQRDYASIAEFEPTHGKGLLALKPGNYLPTICLARALHKQGRSSISLAYYEKALPIRCKEHNLNEFALAATAADEPSRWTDLVRALRSSSGVDGTMLDRVDRQLALGMLIAAGDQSFKRGKIAAAGEDWRRALVLFDARAKGADRTMPATELTSIEKAYTYRQLYRSEYGRMRQRQLVPSVLTLKTAIATTKVSRKRKPRHVYRVMAFVIRKTDINYEAGGRQHHESLTLSNAELATYRFAWRIASESVRVHSQGKVEVRTTWQELEGTTLRGLTNHKWQGIVQTRHLDPTKIDPRPDKAFKKATKENDCIIFIWPRGRAAAAYGGGVMRLPYKTGLLAERGSVRSISPRPSTCLHELLHTMERRLGMPRVHGPRENAMSIFEKHGIRDELDWYSHLIRSVKSWKPLRLAR